MTGNDIKKINKIALFFNIILVVIIAVLVININLCNNEMIKFDNKRFNIIHQANKLKIDLEELVYFAGLYVEKSDIKYRKMYDDTLEKISKNKIKYESLNMDIKELSHFEKLLNMNADAFDSINQIYSTSLIKSSQYLNMKIKSIKYVDNFLFLLHKKMNNEMKKNNDKQSHKFFALYFVFFIFILMDILFFVILKKEHDKLNKKLKQSIEEAIDENRKKDKLLFNQSKHAAMGEMVGSIAHQWRQPLTAIAGHIQMIQFDFEDELINEKYVEKFIDDNMKIISFMSKTIDDFRDFFRENKVKREFRAKKSVESTFNLISAQLDNQEITVEITGDDTCTVYGFESEFQQVVLNLINNSKDEILNKKIKKGTVKIDIFNELNFTVFKFKDNAGGIPEDIIDRIFEPYYTTKEQGQGTGLGLYMSKTIIEKNMGGHISVENYNGGAIFTIIFVGK